MSETQTKTKSDRKLKIRHYLKERFSKKQLITKAIIAAIALVIVVSVALPLYFYFSKNPQTRGSASDFIFIEITHNDGIGFGGLSGKVGVIYLIQSIIFLLLVFVYLFICTDKITASFIAIAMFGGLFNLLQRACSGDHTVLDYFKFGNWIKFPWIFNWPDLNVVIGVMGFIVTYITLTIKRAVKEEKENKLEDKDIPVAPAPKAESEKASK